ncbi:LacI family transcriptional regulator [Enterobacterales bacterium CwR94]|nr:LacI family transcriptional regulator [Enterobacterales bacterium CwR94]
MKERRRRSTGKSTLADVARLVGVSTMTASRALRVPEKVSLALREKIEAAVSELGYVPNLAASGLASASSRLIVMVVPSLATAGCAQASEALQSVLKPHGYQMMLAEANTAAAGEVPLMEMLLAYNPAAIVQFAFECGEEGRRLLANVGLPVIEMGAVSRDSAGISVGVDYARATRDLVEGVAARGFRNIALLCTQNHPTLFRQIMAGWHSGMLAKNFSPHRVVTSAEPSSVATGHRLLSDIRLTWPEIDALICTTDEVACGALMACHAEAIDIPSQLALASLGGGHLSAVCSPPLTSVALPWEEIGRTAGWRLLEALRDEETIETYNPLPAKLILRASTGKH